MISLPVPQTVDYLLNLMQEILRRAVDGTVKPLFVDYTNQRVLIGETTASASPASLEVAGGNAKIVSGGKGIILPNSGATRYYLLSITEVTNDDGTISPTINLTLQ